MVRVLSLWHGRDEAFDPVLPARASDPPAVGAIGHWMVSARASAARSMGPCLARYDLPIDAMERQEYDDPQAQAWPLECLVLDHLDLVRSVVGWRSARTLEDEAWLLAEEPEVVEAAAELWARGRLPPHSPAADYAERACVWVSAMRQVQAFRPFAAALGARLGAACDAVVWRGAGDGDCDLYLVLPTRALEPAEVAFPAAAGAPSAPPTPGQPGGRPPTFP